VVDGNRGRIYVRPSATVVAAVHRQLSEEQTLTTQLQALRDLPARALDGTRLALYANIGLMSELAGARSSGAEGIGLFRTEFIFLMREAFPSEDEQYEIYREMLQCFAPAPVTLRTLDIGGDKILPYFPIEEENPFLGCRGIRFTLDHPEILLIQMRAMLRANAGLNNLQMLFPMISRVGEIDEALGLLARAYRELLDEGQAAAKPTVGAMIEVPSAVYLASALSRRLDFLSIGTNDLTQYLLAVDRNNAQVATPYDSLHPAVINAVRQVIEDAHRQGKPVSVCGEMAGEPAAALLLLGMGVDALSMNPSRFAHVKRVIRGFTRAQASLLLNEALTMEDGFAIDCLLNGALKEAGVTGVFMTTG
jgi:phosphotransferase system enzyme I (PtsP)